MPPEPDLGHPCRLYLISPPVITLDAFEKSLAEALEGGDVGAFQLRLKESSDAEIFEAARRLLPLCRARGVAFILNDRPDIAADVSVDGVHLGQDDLARWPVEKTRKLLGSDAAIGISCHDSSHLAMQAGEWDADYVAFGAFYPTTSKSAESLAKYGTPTIEMLKWWTEYTVIPCVAIGGMTPKNCAAPVTAGADFIAAITAVWNHEKGPKKAVSDFNLAIKQALKQRKPAEAA